jgi:hypothetical protein
MLSGVVSWLGIGIYAGLLSNLTLLWTGFVIRPTAPRWALFWVTLGAYGRWAYVAALIVVALQQDIRFALMSVIGLFLSRWGFIWYLESYALSEMDIKEGKRL